MVLEIVWLAVQKGQEDRKGGASGVGHSVVGSAERAGRLELIEHGNIVRMCVESGRRGVGVGQEGGMRGWGVE